MARGSGKSFLASVAFVLVLARPGAVGAASPSVLDDDTSLPPPAVRHPVALTLLEELAALTVQGAWYWSHSKYWSNGGADVTVEHFFGNLVSDQFVLDDDRFRTNGVGHPIAGAVSYQIARGNGMSVGASFLTSVISSFVWKYFGEWDQTHSTNDLIMTPAAGWVIGEATYRIGRWFASGEPGILNCLGAAALSPFAALNGSSVCGFRHRDRSSLPILPTRHRLAAESGPSSSTFDGGASRTGVAIGFAALIRANAQYQAAGAGSSVAWPGQWSSVSTRLLVEGGAIRGTAFDADALVIGRYVRRYAEANGTAGDMDGWSALVGLSSSFDYEARQLPIGWDRTASAGILGPAIELTARRGPLQLRGWLSATYSFSQVTSLAYAQAAPSFTGVYLKHVLQTEGYYYAQGPVSSAALEGEVGGVRIALEGRMANFWSIDSDYSGQSRIQNNFSLRDTRVFTRAIASLQPLGGPLRLGFELDDDLRDSRIPGTVVRSNELRFMASLALVSR